MMQENNELINHLEKLHTTELGVIRIKKNLSLDTEDVVLWCQKQIQSPQAVITRNGKNWYITVEDCVITVNAYSYTIITAHKIKKDKIKITYRPLKAQEITPTLFTAFQRKQIVTKCVRKEEGQWVVKDIAFVEDWGDEEYQYLAGCLQHTIAEAGIVYGAFANDVLKGFASVEGEKFGSRKQYMDLSSLHVSKEMRGQGIGRELFERAKQFVRQKGAEKLYISSHSAVETQAFYKAMGCVEAVEYEKTHVEKEPCDCQLECVVS